MNDAICHPFAPLRKQHDKFPGQLLSVPLVAVSACDHSANITVSVGGWFLVDFKVPVILVRANRSS
jgi:hypothetical protein